MSVGPEVGDVSSDPSKNKTELVVCTQVNKVSCVTVKEKQSWAVIKVVNHCGKVKDASGLSCAQSRIHEDGQGFTVTRPNGGQRMGRGRKKPQRWGLLLSRLGRSPAQGRTG